MKTNQVICDRNGNRLVTSTTETLRIKASEIEPGDWLLKHGNRLPQRDRLVNSVRNHLSYVHLVIASKPPEVFHKDVMVDVERTR